MSDGVLFLSNARLTDFLVTSNSVTVLEAVTSMNETSGISSVRESPGITVMLVPAFMFKRPRFEPDDCGSFSCIIPLRTYITSPPSSVPYGTKSPNSIAESITASAVPEVIFASESERVRASRIRENVLCAGRRLSAVLFRRKAVRKRLEREKPSGGTVAAMSRRSCACERRLSRPKCAADATERYAYCLHSGSEANFARRFSSTESSFSPRRAIPRLISAFKISERHFSFFGKIFPSRSISFFFMERSFRHKSGYDSIYEMNDARNSGESEKCTSRLRLMHSGRRKR